MSSPRVRKVADRIQVIVAEMLERRIKDPRLGFVTVTDVRVTGDSQQASIFYTVLGTEDELASTDAALESAKGVIRSEVAKQLGMRIVPSLTFIPDALPESEVPVEPEADTLFAQSAATPLAELPSQNSPLPSTFVFLAGIGLLAAGLGAGFVRFRRKQ